VNLPTVCWTVRAFDLEPAGRTFAACGSQTRDFTYVSDVVRATRAAATHPAAVGRTYNVGGPSPVSLAAIDRIGEALGRPVEIRYAAAKRGQARDTGADISRAKAELGYSPSVSLDEGLLAEIEWLLQRARTAAARRGA
jgi:UDP-glucuronate 4-epimerase